MSLLIRALEQAARDRNSVNAGRAAPSPDAPASGSVEPTLEPPPPLRSARHVDPPGPTQTSAAADNPASLSSNAPALSLETSAAPRRVTPTTAALAHIDAQQQRAKAAAVMQASQSGQVFYAYLRGSPVVTFGAIAALFGIGFGIYVYLQVSQPGLFVRQAATRPPENVAPTPAQPSLPTTAPADSVAAGATPPGAAPSPMQQAGTAVRHSGTDVVAAPILSSPATGTVGALPGSDSAPIPTASVIASRSVESSREASAAREPMTEREVEVRREPATQTRTEGAKPAPARLAAPSETASGGRERIAVSATTAQPRVSPALSQAYAALQTGNIEEARTLYSKLSQAEPLNIDALLGVAYIAAQENRSDDAMQVYLRILQINPRHAAAQGALIGLMGRADPIASETRLKQLLAREPSAFLHFVLGNLYADQSLWSQAQQAYFQAHHLEPDNPDYAYNLAVGLDHLRQNKLALGFYRRAEQLAAAQGRSNFNVTHARERISTLSAQLE